MEGDFGTPKLRRLGLGRPRSARVVFSTPSAVSLRVHEDLRSSTPTNSKSETSSNRGTESQPQDMPKLSGSGTITPSRAEIVGLSPLATTSNSNRRPYRLTLSSSMRKHLTKKRLRFHQANSEFVETKHNKKPPKSPKDQKTENSESDDKQFEEGFESHIDADLGLTPRIPTAFEVHSRKKNELKSAIETWKSGFKAAMAELKVITAPQQPITVLLDQLRISQLMLQYIEDD